MDGFQCFLCPKNLNKHVSIGYPTNQNGNEDKTQQIQAEMSWADACSRYSLEKERLDKWIIDHKATICSKCKEFVFRQVLIHLYGTSAINNVENLNMPGASTNIMSPSRNTYVQQIQGEVEAISTDSKEICWDSQPTAGAGIESESSSLSPADPASNTYSYLWSDMSQFITESYYYFDSPISTIGNDAQNLEFFKSPCYNLDCHADRLRHERLEANYTKLEGRCQKLKEKGHLRKVKISILKDKNKRKDKEILRLRRLISFVTAP